MRMRSCTLFLLQPLQEWRARLEAAALAQLQITNHPRSHDTRHLHARLHEGLSDIHWVRDHRRHYSAYRECHALVS